MTINDCWGRELGLTLAQSKPIAGTQKGIISTSPRASHRPDRCQMARGQEKLPVAAAGLGLFCCTAECR